MFVHSCSRVGHGDCRIIGSSAHDTSSGRPERLRRDRRGAHAGRAAGRGAVATSALRPGGHARPRPGAGARASVAPGRLAEHRLAHRAATGDREMVGGRVRSGPAGDARRCLGASGVWTPTPSRRADPGLGAAWRPGETRCADSTSGRRAGSVRKTSCLGCPAHASGGRRCPGRTLGAERARSGPDADRHGPAGACHRGPGGASGAADPPRPAPGLRTRCRLDPGGRRPFAGRARRRPRLS